MLNGVLARLLWPLFALANRWDWLGRLFNRWFINAIVGRARTRPHPWSTAHDYVSWTSLTDQTWSARHLPAHPQDGLPPAKDALALFARPEGRQILCEKSTLLFPAFAQYLTDGFLRTKMPDEGESDDVRRRNTSNHQIDLCTLYGRTPAQTRALRTCSEVAGERGRLKSQTINGEEWPPFLHGPDGAVKPEFAALDHPLGLSKVKDPAQRALIFAVGGDRVNSAPQVMMINTLLLREHNRLAGELERDNPGWDDERVFETARAILIVIFIKIVVEEYINHISPSNFRFRADPSVAWRAPWNKPNWITTEFSLLYRWHALIPDTVTWANKTYPVGATFLNNAPLLETGLARAFVEVSSQKAGKLGAFNTTAALLDVELRSIEQGRICKLAPYADYRAYVKMSRPRSFRAISKNKAVVTALKSIYASPDQVDYYVGLFCETAQKGSPLPPLILVMVAIDAFSQALTNPLLSEHVFNEETFSPLGWRTIAQTATLGELVARNCADGAPGRISMTQ